MDPATGGFDLPYVSSFVISYEHWFTEQWMSQVTWSEVIGGSNGFQPASTYVGAKYAAASVWYIPVANLSLGLEGLYGERENITGMRGSARRLTALVQYNF